MLSLESLEWDWRYVRGSTLSSHGGQSQRAEVRGRWGGSCTHKELSNAEFGWLGDRLSWYSPKGWGQRGERKLCQYGIYLDSFQALDFGCAWQGCAAPPVSCCDLVLYSCLLVAVRILTWASLPDTYFLNFPSLSLFEKINLSCLS